MDLDDPSTDRDEFVGVGGFDVLDFNGWVYVVLKSNIAHLNLSSFSVLLAVIHSTNPSISHKLLLL